MEPRIVLGLFCLFCVQISHCKTVTVQTKTTEVIGVSVDAPSDNVPTLDNLGRATSVDLFLGIPYAQPPLGQLRFARPVSIKSWPSKINAQKFKSPCQQKIAFLKTFYSPKIEVNNLSEDCLYLNIFSPKFNNHGNNTLPVMVWIHGGAYQYGSAMEYDSRVISTYGAVIVTVNYRLGVMGYLSTDNDEAPGNLGMLDQVEALKWIHSNIVHFGGDPNKVTLFGQSSGGATVSTHMFSPLTKGLIHGVIAQSGVATDVFSIYRPPYTLLDTTTSLAGQVSCPTNNTTAMLACLRSKSAQLLVNTNVNHPPMSAAWVPRVDGYYIKDVPENLLARKEIQKIPLTVGAVTSETGGDYDRIAGISKGLTVSEVSVEIKEHCKRYGNKSHDMTIALNCQYGPRQADLDGNRHRVFELMNYYEYIAGIYRLVDDYSQLNRDTWVYSYNYRSTKEVAPAYYGVYHASEIQFEFGGPFFKNFGPSFSAFLDMPSHALNWTQTDIQHSRRLMSQWVYFATHLRNPGSWPRYDKFNRAYTSFESDLKQPILHNQGREDLSFWNKWVPSLLKGEVQPANCPRKFSIIGK